MALRVCDQAHVKASAAIIKDFVEKTQVLTHPNLENDIAYLEGYQLSELLALLPKEFSLETIYRHWKTKMPEHMAGHIATWLWRKGILSKS